MKSTTVVIPNWNGLAFLKTCLDSLRVQDTDDFDVLIIDNASKDESASFIRENYPEFRLEVMAENLGFSGGVNEGIRMSETPYVLLLNNDTECEKAFVSSMIRAIEKDRKIFSVSPKMVKFHDRTKLDDAGDLYTLIGFAAQRGVDRDVNEAKYNKPVRIFSACAGAAIYRKSVFEEMGAFDLNHFAYLEDLDVGWRAQLYGYKNVYEPSAVVYHVGSGTTGSKYNDFKVRISARNNLYLTWKNQSPVQKVVNFLPLYAGRKLKESFFKKLGFGKAYEEGVQEGFEKRKTLKNVPFSVTRIPRYLSIEWQLLVNTFRYFDEYLYRRRMK